MGKGWRGFVRLLFNLLVFGLAFSLPQRAGEKKETVLVREKSPTRAMLFSALFPGMGQFYTENYFKGFLYSLSEGLLLYFSLKEKDKEKRSDLLWWTFGFHLFNIADAYTSAHLYKFQENKSITFLLTLSFP
jgi:TM2 domain-containing membrane protein YozV